MLKSTLRKLAVLLLLIAASALWPTRSAFAQTLDLLGVTKLKAADPTLTGSGVSIIQAEGELTNNNDYQVNPSSVSRPASMFTYIGSTGSIAVGTFPNSVGTESTHADSVAQEIISAAPGVSSIDNYDANYYVNSVITSGTSGVTPSSINSALHNAPIVNQSYSFGTADPTHDPGYNLPFDYYANKYNILFIDGAGFGGAPQSPSTAYNSISVNALITSPSTSGPTSNGRSKPDLMVLSNETSYAAGDATGATALLLQAIDNNVGGPGTAAAAGDIRTMKALLLNGADKPASWSHTATAPLDTFYGAGMMDVFNSWQELKQGRQNVSAAVTSGSLQAPVNLVLSSGWDLGSLPNGTTTNHYFFTAPVTSGSSDTLTATIDWNASHWDGSDNAIINNLFLALYDTTNLASPVAISDSTVDNLQQLYVSGLVPGRTYDLRVYEPSAVVAGGAESYGLAYVVVPEPGTLVLLGAVALLGIAAYTRRRIGGGVQ